jgi:integrase
MSKARKQVWLSTRIPNLFQLQEGGRFYGRVKIEGESVRKSLDTTSFAVARERLRDWLLSLKVVKTAPGNTFGSLIESYVEWLAGEKVKEEIGASTIAYKEELLDQIRKTWPGFDTFKLETLTEQGMRNWQVAHRGKYSATRTNGALTVLRELIALAVSRRCLSREIADEALRGLKYVRVRYDYKRMTLSLPEPQQVIELRNEVYRRCRLNGSKGGWLFDFLLFSGSRIQSARDARWEDVLWNSNTHGELYFRSAKYGPYQIPLFPQLRTLLETIKAATPNAQPDDEILPTKSLQSVLTSSCRHVKLQHLSHHDLRHIFASRCMESGKDLPLIAAWLGHKDGGRTAMAIYGHIRSTHSQEQSQTLDFLAVSKDKKEPSAAEAKPK